MALVSIPEEIQTQNLESLGIQLIRTLSDQLSAELIIHRENGLWYQLVFSQTMDK